jgi:hypothetical protein
MFINEKITLSKLISQACMNSSTLKLIIVISFFLGAGKEMWKRKNVAERDSK